MNPAFSGSNGVIVSFATNSRQQWSITGNPQFANLHCRKTSRSARSFCSASCRVGDFGCDTLVGTDICGQRHSTHEVHVIWQCTGGLTPAARRGDVVMRSNGNRKRTIYRPQEYRNSAKANTVLTIEHLTRALPATREERE